MWHLMRHSPASSTLSLSRRGVYLTDSKSLLAEMADLLPLLALADEALLKGLFSRWTLPFKKESTLVPVLLPVKHNHSIIT